jgi:hypothetical protein
LPADILLSKSKSVIYIIVALRRFLHKYTHTYILQISAVEPNFQLKKASVFEGE